MRVLFFLDEIEINPPKNYPELEIELNFDTDNNSQALSINDWDFGVGDPSSGKDGLIMCKNQFKDPAGVGVIKGKPYRIEIDNEIDDKETLFNGFVDLFQGKFKLSGKEWTITASAKQAGKIDWLNEYADSFTYDYLYSIGFFDKSKFINMPYVVAKKQDVFEIAMTTVTIFVLIDKLREQIKDVSQLVASSANPLEMSAIPRLILQIVYIITLFASLVTLLLRLFYLLVPPVKFHKVMYVKDLFEIAASYMGLKFKSSILQQGKFSRLAIMPEKFNLTENQGKFAGIAGDFKNNNEATGHFKGTFGDLVRGMRSMFEAKCIIDEDILYFEREDFELSSNGITIPSTFENKEEFTLNYEDYFANTLISFMTDLQDRHTIQEFQGTSVQIFQTPKSSFDPKYSLAHGFNEKRIPFALAKQKTELTFIEDILKGFLSVLDGVLNALISIINTAIDAINVLIKILNAIIKALNFIGIKIKLKINPIPKIKKPKLANLISNRIGMLKMESDYVAVPKIFLLDKSTADVNTKLSADNVSAVNAKYLFENFHYIKSFVSVNGSEPWQWLIKDSDRFPMSYENFKQALKNNSIFTPEGEKGKLISLRFNPIKQYATCKYKVRKQYLYNLKLEYVEPTGK